MGRVKLGMVHVTGTLSNELTILITKENMRWLLNKIKHWLSLQYQINPYFAF